MTASVPQQQSRLSRAYAPTRAADAQRPENLRSPAPKPPAMTADELLDEAARCDARAYAVETMRPFGGCLGQIFKFMRSGTLDHWRMTAEALRQRVDRGDYAGD